MGTKNDANSGQHGTCMLSRTVGPEFGVSKRAALTIVRLPAPIRGPGDPPLVPLASWRMSTLVDGIAKVLQDVFDRGIQNQAVISLSLSSTVDLGRFPVPGDDLFPLYLALTAVVSKGIVVTVSGGGNGVISKWGVRNPIPVFISDTDRLLSRTPNK
jgi:hypothetical protein